MLSTIRPPPQFFQKGDGILFRDAGKFPPASRDLIAQVGDEKITKMTLFKYPISVSSFAKALGALKNTPYDSLVHIGVIINDKYLTEKDAVLTFERAGVPKQSTDTLNVPITKDITINELLETTRKKVGDERFSTYCALNSRDNCGNCQRYLTDLLKSNGLSTPATEKFILQDLTEVAKNLPGFTDALSNAFTGAKALVNRLFYGEGQCCDEC
jgi:hypothetical protein